ncbi:hypothetical protein M8J76_015796 [Diaphorina citri]|nr:hypothetical protein M8J76_015796 [Diaphorina citri]
MWLVFLLIFHSGPAFGYIGESLEEVSPNSCGPSEVFSFYLLQCEPCDAKLNLVPSEKKDACECDKDSVHTGWNKNLPRCVKCPPNTQANTDHTGCLRKLECAPNEIELDRNPDGTLLNQTQCQACATHTTSNRTHCTRRGFNVSYAGLEQWPDTSDSYRIVYESSPPLVSEVLRVNLRRALAYCINLKKYSYCDTVANLCVLQLYKDSGPCHLFRDHHHIPWSASNEANLPWLFYGEGDAITVLTRKKIPVKYSLKQHSELNWLNLTAIKYSYAVSDPDLNSGSHTVHMMNLSGADLQLCYGDRAALNNALRFGTFYQRKCKLYVKDLLSMKRTEIFELFLSYRDENGKPTLYTIPKSDMSTWQLVRRFFLVDTMLGVSSLDSNSGPSVIRYVKSATLR